MFAWKGHERALHAFLRLRRRAISFLLADSIDESILRRFAIQRRRTRAFPKAILHLSSQVGWFTCNRAKRRTKLKYRGWPRPIERKGQRPIIPLLFIEKAVR